MSEQELGKALLELDAHRLAGAGDAREQTWKILERDRNRVWWWTAITFTLWGLAIFMVALMMVLYALVFPMQAKLHQNDQLERIVKMMSSGRQVRRDQVAVKVGERFLLVHADDIIYASLADESINIVTGHVSGSSNYRTLDDLQARLDPDVFWRVHRSHLVNINKIKEIVPWFSRNYILRMKDAKSTEIPVSRSQTKRLREYLKL